MDNKKPNNILSQVIHGLGSLKLAVLLLMTLATVIAFATVLEADYGRFFAQWHVYHSYWFMALLLLLGVNIFFAAVSRFPWKRPQTGFVVTHGGLLVLLVGAVLSFRSGVDGQVTLKEGESTTQITIPQKSQITASWGSKPGAFFSFEAGPSDWREGTRLDLGEVNGISARVLRYYAQAKYKECWIANVTGMGGPAVKYKIEGPHGGGGEENLLVDQRFGDDGVAGPFRVQLRRASSRAMLDDFQKPPTDNLGKKGLLLAYYKDQVKHIAVDENLGKKVVFDDTGAAVEIVEYMPNAEGNGDLQNHFHTVGEKPRNPMLELKVHEPGKNPMRQVAFAKKLLNLDPDYEQPCPMKFHYVHPAMGTALELLQTDDGQLYCRVFAGQQLLPKGEVKVGSRISMPGPFEFCLVEYLPHSRGNVVFEPQPATANQKDKSEAAAEIEIAAAGVTQTFWLQRNHSLFGSHTMVTPQGMLGIRFGNAETPLGYSLKLVKFHKGVNPGGVGDAAFSSVVQLVDEDRGIDEERNVSMNEPLTYNGLTFYQAGFNDVGHGIKTSTFSVACDPGRAVKYGGCLLICLGIAIMFYMRAYFFKRVQKLRQQEVALSRENNSPFPASELVFFDNPARGYAGPSGVPSDPATVLEPQSIV